MSHGLEVYLGRRLPKNDASPYRAWTGDLARQQYDMMERWHHNRRPGASSPPSANNKSLTSVGLW